jgi:hypothetical protein
MDIAVKKERKIVFGTIDLGSFASRVQSHLDQGWAPIPGTQELSHNDTGNAAAFIILEREVKS